MRSLSDNMPFGKFRWASPFTRDRLALSMAVLSAAAALLAAVPAEARDRTRPTISSARVIDPYLVEVTFSEQMEYAAHAHSAKIIVNGTEYPKNMATMMCYRAAGAGTCNTHNTQWLWVQVQDPIYSGDTVTFSYSPTEEESGYRIRDRAHNQLLKVTSYPVTNNSTATKPTLTIERVDASVAAGGTADFRIRATANGAVWPSLTRTISSRPGSHGFPFQLVGLPVYVEYSTPFGSQVKHLMRQHRDGNNYWDLEKYVPTGRGSGPLTVTVKPYGKFYSVGSSSSICIRIGSGPACASGQVSAEPLTAEFDDVPGSHDGTAFSFQIEFSEAVWASADQMRSAVGVTGGTMTAAALATGSNRLWDFTVTPSGTGTVTLSLTLPETCTETGAICTSDGRKLSTATAIEVAYGSGLSVADAEAIEGEDTTLDFTVTLSPPVSGTVTVAYATSDGTATAGSDYTATSGTLTFSSNETTKTVSVPILDDTVEDHGETFTLTLSNPTGALLADATATGTITAPPLTATFGDVPEYHDGENTFTFSLQFSENLAGLGHATLRDNAFYISGGSVTAARRKTRGSNQSWEIEVRPSARETVAISLPVGSVASSDGRSLSAAVSATVAPQPLLTAGFQDVPVSHDGENTFTFSLQFSENVLGLGYATLRNAFEIDGGSVTAARRKTQGNNQSWEITVEPDGNGAVSITLPAGEVETSDGRSLNAAVSATVASPATTPLTASFQDVPASHDGENTFTFNLQFSENVAGLGHETLRDDAFEIDGGDIIAARRKTSGNNQSWEIEIEPDGNGAVSITLPAGAVETSGGLRLNAAVSASVAGPTLLTASFQDVPASHDGENTFTFNLQFSENVEGLGYATLRDDAFEIDGGDVITARRITPGNNQSWEITVEPDGNGAVSITLPAGAVETSGGRSLSAAVSASVAGPPVGVSVADAEIDEGEGAVLSFAVTLSRAAEVAMTVDYATSDGTAQAGSDYTAASGTLSFAVGESSKTIEVSVLNDSHDEGDETLTLTLSNASTGVLSDSEATGTIKNHDPMPLALVARFGRTAAVYVVEQVEERMAAPRRPGFEGRFAGRPLRSGAERDFGLSLLNQPGIGGGTGAAMHQPMGANSVRQATPAPLGAMAGLHGGPSGDGLYQSDFGGDEVLAGSAFSLNRETRHGGILSLWSRGARSYFSGQDGSLSLGGDVRTMMLGGDYAKGPLVAGLSLAHSQGPGEYAGTGGGQVALAVTGLYPWLGYRATERVTVWGVAGYGVGGLLLTPDGAPALRSGLSMAMAAAGTRGELVAGGARGFELAFKTDALWVGTSLAGVDGPAGRLNAAEAAVTRFRTGLEGARTYTSGGPVSLTPSVEVGLRHDGGDAETGAGMDLGAGLIGSDASTGLAVDVRVRTLLVHQAEGFRERGMAVSLSYNPTPSTPLGFTARVAPSWGGQATRGSGALWGRETMAGMAHGSFAQGPRLDGELGYGLPLGGRLVGTSRVGLSTSEYGQAYRIGYGVAVLDRESLNFELGVDAQRRESSMLGGADTGFFGRATLGW